MSILVCLVSQQAMANVIPALELRPEKVVLLTTSREMGTAENIKKVLNESGIDTEIFHDLISPYNLDKIKLIIRKLFDEYKNDMILNVTGGTKTMAISAFEIFKENNKPVIYYDPDHHSIMSLTNNSEPEKVKNKLDIKSYLKSYGYEIYEEGTTKGRAESKEKFFAGFDETRFIEFSLFLDYIRKNYQLNEPRINRSLTGFTFTKNFDVIRIIDDKSKESLQYDLSTFAFGDWLEDYFYLKLKKENYDDVKYAVKFKTNGIENEIDVLASKDCKLFLYSCKSGKSEQKDLMQIDILRKLAGGIFGKAFFLSTSNLGEGSIQRAKILNVNLLTGVDIFNYGSQSRQVGD